MNSIPLRGSYRPLAGFKEALRQERDGKGKGKEIRGKEKEQEREGRGIASLLMGDRRP